MQSVQFGTSDRFRIIRVLGEGATGRVFEAEDRVHGGRFALRRLPVEQAIASEQSSSFEDEFRVLEHVEHPNLAKVYELIADVTGTYVVMELIEGVDFVSYLRPAIAGRLQVPDGELSVDRVRSALSQLVSGLLALHALGKVHCDVKPDNVLVRRNGRVVLLDFGRTTEDGRALRSEANGRASAFVAPEQAEGIITEASDWYAMGVLLYLALTGRLPFPGTLQIERSAPPVDPRRIAPELPDDLAQLVLRLLEPNPAERPSDREMAKAFGLSHDAHLQGVAPAFVGRDAELAQLERSFEQIFPCGRRVVHVQGESGIGKTALLRSFARSLALRGALVLRGACYVEASVPYKGLDRVIDRLAADLGRFGVELGPAEREALEVMFPVFRMRDARERVEVRGAAREQDLDPRRTRLRAVAALRSLVERLASKAPIAVIIDDFQWADADSIDLLADVFDAPAFGPLLLVVGYRSQSAGQARTSLSRTRLAPDDEVLLGPLTEHAIREIAGHERTPRELRTLVAESRGNPFFLGELLRARTELASPHTITFKQLLLSRIDDLSAKQRSYLELVSIAGRPVEAPILSGALGVSRNAALEIRRALAASCLIRSAETRGHAVEPYHDRIRDHVLRTLAPDVSRSRHNALAAAYEASESADPETLAHHHRAAGNHAKALVNTELAGDAAARSLAFEHAANLFIEACDMAEGDARTALRIKQANALSSAEYPARAALAFVAALEDRPHDVQLMLSAGDEFLRAGQIERGLQYLDSVARSVRASIPKSNLSALLALVWHAQKLRRMVPERFASRQVSANDRRRLELYLSIARRLATVDLTRPVLFQIRYFRLAMKVGSRSDIVNGLALLAASTCHMPAALAGGVSGAERRLRAAESSLVDSDPVQVRLHIAFARAMIEVAQSRLEPARRELDRTIAIARDEQAHGLQWEIANCQSLVSLVLWMQGDVPELRRRLPGYAQDASGYLTLAATDKLRIGTMIALCDDRPEEARRLARASMAHWPAEPWHFLHFFDACAQSEIDLYEGAPQAAWKRSCGCWKRSREAGVHQVVYFFLAAVLLRARAALAAGLIAEAERDIRLLRARPEEWVVALAAALGATLSAARGRTAEAVRALDDATVGLEKWNLGLHLTAARYRRAELARDSVAQQAALDALASLSVRAPKKMIDVLLPDVHEGSGLRARAGGVSDDLEPGRRSPRAEVDLARHGSF